MNTINQWSVLICLSSAACIIIELILPPGNMSKSLKMVLGLFILASFSICITNNFPKININFNKLNKDNQNTKKIESFMDGIDQQIKSVSENNLELIIKRNLKNFGIKNEKIKIFMDTDKNNCISISKCKIIIPSGTKKSGSESNLDNGDLMKIKNDLEKTLNIETEVIMEK